MISDDRSRFSTNFRFVTQCFWVTQQFFCRSVGWWFWRVLIRESRLFTKHHFILFFLCFQQLNNALVMCRALARFPLFLAKQRNLKDRKSISFYWKKQMSFFVPGNLLYGDFFRLCWFFSWRNLASFPTMLRYIKWNRDCYNIPSLWPTLS